MFDKDKLHPAYFYIVDLKSFASILLNLYYSQSQIG